MSENPDSAPPTFAQLAQFFAAGNFAPLAQAYAQVQTAHTAVDRTAAVEMLHTLSENLHVDVSQAERFLPQLEEGKDGFTLEELQESLKRFCEEVGAERKDSSAEEQREGSEKSKHSSKSSRSSARRAESPPSDRHSPQASAQSSEVPQQEEAKEPEQRPSRSSVGELKPAEEDLQRLTGEIDQVLKAMEGEKEASPQQSANTSSISEDPLVKKLRDSITEFEAMQAEREEAGEDVSALHSVLKTLKQQLEKVTHGTTPDEKNRQRQIFSERCARSVHELFQFYSNQLRLLGKSPSFDLIQHNSHTWNISKFVRFCQDFNLLTEKHKKEAQKTLDLVAVKSVFCRNSVLQKEMSEEQFTQALRNLADLYYDAEYDRLHKGETATKSADEKRDMFYRHLKLHHLSECMKRAKGFGMPFSSNTDNRMPEHDLAQKYKYKPRRQLNPIVKEDKCQVSNPPTKAPTPPKLAPADAIVAYSSKPEESVTQQKYGVKARNPFSWKTLGELSPEELMGRGEELDLSTLIAEDSSDDELLKKQYPLAASQPVLPKDPPKFPSPRKRAKEQKPPPKPIDLVQKTKDLSVSMQLKEKQQLGRTLKAEEAQRERGNKVLERLRQSSQY